MKFKRVVLSLLLLISLNSAPAGAGVLERKSIWSFHISAVRVGQNTYLHIRGLPADSASIGCSKPCISRAGSDLCLTTNIKYIGKGHPFNFVLTIPEGVKRVLFGKSRTEIWPNDEGAEAYSSEQKQAIEVAKKEFLRDNLSIDLSDYLIFLKDSEIHTDSYSVQFLKDGPTPTELVPSYLFQVSKKDYGVTYKGCHYGGSASLLMKLGKEDKTWMSAEKPRKAEIEILETP